MLEARQSRLDFRKEQAIEAQKPSISPLRQRMIEHMRLRKLGEKTQSQYLRAVEQMAQYLGRSPDTASRSLQPTRCIAFTSVR